MEAAGRGGEGGRGGGGWECEEDGEAWQRLGHGIARGRGSLGRGAAVPAATSRQQPPARHDTSVVTHPPTAPLVGKRVVHPVVLHSPLFGAWLYSTNSTAPAAAPTASRVAGWRAHLLLPSAAVSTEMKGLCSWVMGTS